MFLESIDSIQQTVRVSNSLTNYQFIIDKKQSVYVEYLYRYLTDDFIRQIETYEFEDDAAKQTMFQLLNKAIIKLAVFKSIAELEITISDVGITRQESDNDKTAYSGQVARLEASLEEEAFTLIDAFIGLCYQSELDGFETQPIYLMNVGLAFHSAAEFSQRIRLHRQFITFYQLHPNLVFVQQNFVMGRFTSAVYDLIMQGPAPEHLRARNFLLFGVAYLTLADAMIKGLVQMTSEGVKFIGSDNVDSNSNALQSSDNQLSAQLKHYQEIGKQQLEMVSFIIASAPSIFGVSEMEQTTTNTFFT